MNITEALGYINNLPKFAYPLGNEQLKSLLPLLGSPQNSLKCIHIAGTNGKGSASAMLSAILTKAGYKTGLFTSPYIIRFNERIRIGDNEIPDERLCFYVEKLSKITEENGIKISQFAFILAVAFCYYRDKKCDLAVLEAGLGGRLDATNVIEKSLVSVIMSIGLDHTEYLGNTIAEIAREKGGIIKENGDAVVYGGQIEANRVFKEICQKQQATLYIADGEVPYKLSLGGKYQIKNAAVVLKVIEVLRKKGILIPESAVCDGFLSAKHRGRFEWVRDNVVVDGAHNPDGIEALCTSLTADKRKKTAVMAMMEDKAVDSALLKLKGFSGLIVTELSMPRCMKKEILAEKAKNAGLNVLSAADLSSALKTAENSELAVVCGSIYLAGEALKYFDK